MAHQGPRRTESDLCAISICGLRDRLAGLCAFRNCLRISLAIEGSSAVCGPVHIRFVRFDRDNSLCAYHGRSAWNSVGLEIDRLFFWTRGIYSVLVLLAIRQPPRET